MLLKELVNAYKEADFLSKFEENKRDAAAKYLENCQEELTLKMNTDQGDFPLKIIGKYVHENGIRITTERYQSFSKMKVFGLKVYLNNVLRSVKTDEVHLQDGDSITFTYDIRLD